MPRVHVVGGIDAAVEVGRSGAKRLQDARRMRQERRVEERRDRRARSPMPTSAAFRRSLALAGADGRAARRSACDHHARAHAASDAGSTMTDVSLVAIARPAATPASAGQRRPPLRHRASERDRERQREAGEHRLLDVHPRVEDHRRRDRHQHGGSATAVRPMPAGSSGSSRIVAAPNAAGTPRSVHSSSAASVAWPRSQATGSVR